MDTEGVASVCAGPTSLAHLGNNGDLESQVVQANLSNVHPIDDDLPFCRLIDPEQTQGE